MSKPSEGQDLGEETAYRRRETGKRPRVWARLVWETSKKADWFPQRGSPGRWASSRVHGQEFRPTVTLRTEALRTHRHLEEGAGLPTGRGREAGAESQRLD